MKRASEHNLVVLLDKWSARWKHRGRTRAIGPHAYEKYCTLGFHGHGGVFGISKASEMKRACMAVNHFLRERFPSKTWTSITVLYNPSMPLHRDILNMIGHANHAVALGNFLEGRVWIEDENGQATTVLETKNGQKLLRGTWLSLISMFQNCVMLRCTLWLFRSWCKFFFPDPAGTRSETWPRRPRAGF